MIQSEQKTGPTHNILLYKSLLYWPAICFLRASLKALRYVDGFAINSFNIY